MDVRLQAKLLRVLEEGVIEPLGTNRRVPVDVRIVSSTNRDLEAAMRTGTFREDLYFRLNVFHVQLPPLRERREDVPALGRSVPRRVRPRARQDRRPASTRTRPRCCAATPGPGTCASCATSWSAPPCSRRRAGPRRLVRAIAPPGRHGNGASADQSLEHALADLERQLILDALAATDDNKPAAAKRLGIGERTLWTKLKKHGI